jgi:hypothetical protein
MKLILSLLVFAGISGAHAETAKAKLETPTFTPSEITTMTEDLAKALQDCPNLKDISKFEVTVSNRTADHIDKQPIVDLLNSKFVAPANVGKGNAEVRVAILSQTRESKTKKELTYTMRGQVMRENKEVCKQEIQKFKSVSAVTR